GRVPPENVDGDLEFTAFRIDFLDHAAEVEERSVVDFDGFTDLKIDLRFFRLFRRGNLGLDGLDFIGGCRHGRFAADEPDHALGFLDEIPGLFDDALVLIQQHHVHKHVARPQFAAGHGLLLIAHLDDLFHRDEDFPDEVLHLVGLDALLDAFLDLLLLAGKRMNDKPLAAHGAQITKNIKYRMRSTTSVNAPIKAIEIMMSVVEPFSSTHVGHEHFFNSSRVSCT